MLAHTMCVRLLVRRERITRRRQLRKLRAASPGGARPLGSCSMSARFVAAHLDLLALAHVIVHLRRLEVDDEAAAAPLLQRVLPLHLLGRRFLLGLGDLDRLCRPLAFFPRLSAATIFRRFSSSCAALLRRRPARSRSSSRVACAIISASIFPRASSICCASSASSASRRALRLLRLRLLPPPLRLLARASLVLLTRIDHVAQSMASAPPAARQPRRRSIRQAAPCTRGCMCRRRGRRRRRSLPPIAEGSRCGCAAVHWQPPPPPPPPPPAALAVAVLLRRAQTLAGSAASRERCAT